jgi:hypothetical protein
LESVSCFYLPLVVGADQKYRFSGKKMAAHFILHPPNHYFDKKPFF